MSSLHKQGEYRDVSNLREEDQDHLMEAIEEVYGPSTKRRQIDDSDNAPLDKVELLSNNNNATITTLPLPQIQPNLNSETITTTNA